MDVKRTSGARLRAFTAPVIWNEISLLSQLLYTWGNRSWGNSRDWDGGV